MKGKTRAQKGITLIALIITIVVLLILAAVAISSITGDGILSYAQNVTNDYNQAAGNEQDMLQQYVNYLNNHTGSSNNGGTGDGNGSTTVTLMKIVDKDGNDISNKKVETNTEAYDGYGNKIVVPAGFKIRVDDTTNNADTVTEGIVIEDCTEAATQGSQFVWIPVGKVYTDTAKTEANAKTITLGRYSSFTATDGVYTPAQTASNYAIATKINSYYTEDTATNHNSSYGNSIARNIEDFVTSATQKGGYYIGRYEAGDSSNTAVANRTGEYGTSTAGTLVCKANQVPYNWITQSDASSKCQAMYANGYKADGTGTFSSDLINSYAWDTAIVFIQTFGTKTNSSTYSSTDGKSSTEELQTTGTNILKATSAVDEQLNIYDMAGNSKEWSTETYNGTDGPCVTRGGNNYNSRYYTSYRSYTGTTHSTRDNAFRPLLYVGL